MDILPQEIVAHFPDLITVINKEGVILFESDAVLPLVGYTKEELVGKNSLALIHPLDFPNAMTLLAEVIKQPGKKYFVQLRFKHKNGSWILLEMSGVYLPDVPSISGVLIISRDISASKKIDNLTKTLEKAIGSSGEIIFITDVNGIFSYVNPQFTAVYGFTSDEVCGKMTPRIIKSGKHTKEEYEQFWQKLLHKEVVSGEIVNKNKSGLLLTVEGSSSSIVDDNGQIVGFLSIQRDISGRKKLEQDLGTYKLAIENATNHIVITDLDGKVIFANEAVTRITGYSHEEVVGNNPRLWGRQMDKTFFENMWHVIKIEKKPFVGELINKRKSGEQYTAQASISPIIDASGVLIGFVGVEVDITDYKHAEEAKTQKAAELERMNALMVNRELKMVELKKQIEELEIKLAEKT
jgi:PAS domain S-box-containing protein